MTERPLRVLVVEPWFGGSHRAWAEGYAASSRHQVDLVTHAGWSWRWRLEGGSLTLARQAEALIEAVGRPDVVLAGGMLNLPAFLGFARRSLDGVPVALYMHENQLTYPIGDAPTAAGTYAIINWLSVAAADRVFFNSRFHLDEFFAALPSAVFDRAGDYRHDEYLSAAATRAAVLGVGVDLGRLDGPRIETGPPVVLWNHRWEHDKDPAAFAAAVLRLAGEGVAFRLILAGERVGDPPSARLLESELADRIIHSGFAPAGLYPELLRQATVVVSTARQEFFGVSIVEASYAGALPIVPDRLAYPELLPVAVHPHCLYRTDEELIDRLGWALTRPDEARQVAARLHAPMARFDWDQMAPRYDDALASLAGV